MMIEDEKGSGKQLATEPCRWLKDKQRIRKRYVATHLIGITVSQVMRKSRRSIYGSQIGKHIRKWRLAPELQE